MKAVWLKALCESYRVIRGVFNVIAYHVRIGVCVGFWVVRRCIISDRG